MLTHTYISYQIKTKNSFSEKLCVTYGTPYRASGCLALSILLARHYPTQWSSGTAPLLLTGRWATPVITWWFTANATDLRERFSLSGIFYLALLAAFSRLSWSWQFNLKVSRASCWSFKYSPGPTICLNHSNPQTIHMWCLFKV